MYWGSGTAVGKIMSQPGVGGRGAIAPPPPSNNAFLEFCQYIWRFVGTCEPTSTSFVPKKYLKYQQNIERNSSFICENAKIFEGRSLRSLAYS